MKAVVTLVFASILLLLLPSFLFANSTEATSATTLIVSTRGHFGLSSGDLRPGYSNIDYNPPLALPSCSSDREVVVYVHGWNAFEQDAISQFNVVKESLESIGYSQPVIGFSWDSDTLDWWDWWEAWPVAKDIAQQNGLKLGKFILDFKTYCEEAKIRLVGHSLGASVILNALDRLHNDQELALWNDINRNYKVASVHLLGAAVNPEEVSVIQGFGVSIREEVDQFHNKFSQEDDVLEGVYLQTEEHVALGEEGAQGMQSGLENIYHEQEVSNEISRDSDGDGIDEETHLGDNHMGYAGVVNENNGQLTSDGAMNLVVMEWSTQ